MIRSTAKCALAPRLIAALSLASCLGNELPPEAACTDHLQISAEADPTATSSGVRVFGAIMAPADVTVRSVDVAGTPVPRTEFNYRGFQVDVPQALLEALAEDGIATLSVTAYTSRGCSELAEDARPSVEVATRMDAGTETDIR